MNKSLQQLSKQKILSFAFLEGATVMAVELLSSKMIAPFFGTSLYTWSAVLAITLMALTGGYFLGAKLSSGVSSIIKTLAYLLSGIFIWVLIMPFLGHSLMSNLIEMDYKIAAIISAFFIIVPPMVLLGSVSPLLINILGNEESPGKASGTIFTVSTLGGVIFTFVLGFFLIPEFGIRMSCIITSIFILIPLAILFSMLKN